MINQPAAIFIIVFTLLNMAACLWLMWWTARTRVPAPHAQRDETSGVDTTGHVWDGDLEELNNPLPRWWLGLFVITVIFGAGYLIFYPGLGNYSGVSNWTSTGELHARVEQQQQLFETRMAPLRDLSLTELARNPQAMGTARNLFNANCAACHGSDARGARGFPNLTDDDWLWGNDEQVILQTIAEGRHGIMPPLGGAMGEQGVNEVASYVVSLSGGTAPEDWVKAGEARFQMLCVACHGMDGKGNPLLGAPDLTDDIWLHGGDFQTIRDTITNGRDNQMPAHGEALGETRVRLLAAYVLSLAPPPAAAATTAAQP